MTEPDGSESVDAMRERVASLPCVIVAVDRPVGDRPPLADLVIELDVATLEDVLAVIESNPIAATSLALLLRGADHREVGDGLVAESAVYSMLQAGPEFARWRSEHPPRVRRGSARPPVRVERDGERLDLVFDRPEVRNALDREMRTALLDGLAVAEADASIVSVVLRGDGPSFCSGGDLDEFGTFDDPSSAHLVRLTASIGRSIHHLADRTLALVHGPCAGSGVELPAFARHVAATDDFRASLPEVTLGLIPGAGGTTSISRRVGRHRTALLALSAVSITAPVALRWGLVDELPG